jgi:amino acid adenylation domain-containing protein
MRYLLFNAIDSSAERYPDGEAIRFSGQCLTNAELSLYSSNLARILIEQGVSRGDRVGIYMNKGLESAIAIYGIMKAGAAYVPLDPFAPVSRIGYVIKDCGIRHLVSKPAKLVPLRQLLADGCPIEHVIGLDRQDDLQVDCIPWDEVRLATGKHNGLALTEQDLAYILYTSGSTGVPKGIMHTHRSGLSFAEWGADTYGLSREDRLSNHAPLHFDLSTFDFFAGAIAGATTVIIPEAYSKFPRNMAKFIEEERISVWYSVPFALIQLMQHGNIESSNFSALRWILFAGEVFPTKHLRQLMSMLPGIRFSNLYGPTETNVCTYYHVTKLPENPDETIPIGKACQNVEDLVVDLDDKPVLPGEVGELLIRGGVVMKGYWGQPEKNHNAFYRRLVFDQFEDLFYRTGDLVQLDADGYYRYLGRKDRQIKTRGYRVELDEVEVALLAHPGVEEAAVYPVPDGEGSNLIEASVIPKQDASLNDSDLVQHLTGRLPIYARPARIDILPDFPRTSTGKINRRELQEQATIRVNEERKK